MRTLLGLVATAAVLGLGGFAVYHFFIYNPSPPPPPTTPELGARPAPPPTAVSPPMHRFREGTAAAGIDFVHVHGGYGQKLMPETIGSGVLIFDYDQDGDQDILFVNSGRWSHYKYKEASPPTHPVLYQNDGKGHFTDVSEQAGLEGVDCYGMGIAAGDIDNDGYPEVFIAGLCESFPELLASRRQSCYLLHNEGGKRFRDVTEEAGIRCPGWSTAAAFLDYDGDKRLDIFVGHYVRWSPETDFFCRLTGDEKSYCQPMNYEGEHCQLFRNLDGRRFEDVSARAGIQVFDVLKKRASSKCLGVAVHDYNDDGYPDIAVANDTTPNFLFHNNGNGTFTNVASARGVELLNDGGSARGAMGIAWGYFRDGKTLGLAIANFSNEPNGLLRYYPESETFQDTAAREGLLGPSRLPLKFGLMFLDYDFDGRLDLFTSNGHIEPEINRVQATTHAQAAQLFWNAGPSRGAGCYREVTAAEAGPDLFVPRVGRACAYGDLDGDGDLDIVLNNNDGRATVLFNEAPPTAKAVRLRFRLANGNRDGFGTRVKLWTGDVMQQAELNSGGSYISQNEAVLTFGLGKATKADQIEIRWPGAEQKVTELKELAAGFTYVVDEEKGIVEKQPFRR